MSGGEANAATAMAHRHRTDVAGVLARILEVKPGVTFRRTFGAPAYYTGGKMFACASGGGIAVKLPPERITELPPPVFGPFSPGGRMVMGGWVAISRERPEDFVADADLIDEAIAYVAHVAAVPAKRSRRGD